MIEQYQSTAHIVDAQSVQAFLNKLGEQYGATKQLKEDLLKSGDINFEMWWEMMEEMRPNHRQFALPQYCIGKLYEEQR